MNNDTWTPLKYSFVGKRPFEDCLVEALENFKANWSDIRDIEKAVNAFDNTPVVWNSRLRTTAGRASRRKIELSKYVFDNMSESEQRDTISHEFAHVVDYYIRNRSGHDSFWKAIHRAMGGSGKRCHNSTVKANKRKRHVYVDQDRGKAVRVSTRVHNDLMCRRRAFRQGTHFKYVGYEVYQGNKLIDKVMF